MGIVVKELRTLVVDIDCYEGHIYISIFPFNYKLSDNSLPINYNYTKVLRCILTFPPFIQYFSGMN